MMRSKITSVKVMPSQCARTKHQWVEQCLERGSETAKSVNGIAEVLERADIALEQVPRQSCTSILIHAEVDLIFLFVVDLRPNDGLRLLV